jgi:hypothetical protein
MRQKAESPSREFSQDKNKDNKYNKAPKAGWRDYEMKALWEAVVVGQRTGMKRKEEEEENEAATGTRGSGASEDR